MVVTVLPVFGGHRCVSDRERSSQETVTPLPSSFVLRDLVTGEGSGGRPTDPFHGPSLPVMYVFRPP